MTLLVAMFKQKRMMDLPSPDDSRNPHIQKFIWNADDTPNFGKPLSAGANITKPAGE